MLILGTTARQVYRPSQCFLFINNTDVVVKFCDALFVMIAGQRESGTSFFFE